MSQPCRDHSPNRGVGLNFFIATLLCSVPPGFADEPPVELPPPSSSEQAEQTRPPETRPSPEAGEVQGRGFPSAVIPGTVPSTTAHRYVAPTPSLDLIANALTLSYPNSLTIDLNVPANLAVTVPVEISVLYSASGQRLTRTYAPATGTLIRYQDDERDGLPRPMRLDINLRELVPNGQSFHFSPQFTMTPLYDVTVGGLNFFLYADCDAIGKSDIRLEWMSPENKYHYRDFKLKGGDTKFIEFFSWTVRNVSLANLYEPLVRFDERDPGFGYGFNPLPVSGRRLTPQTPKQFEFTLLEGDVGPPSNPGPSFRCKARISYGIARTLR